jgi:hypothetical protein
VLALPLLCWLPDDAGCCDYHGHAQLLVSVGFLQALLRDCVQAHARDVVVVQYIARILGALVWIVVRGQQAEVLKLQGVSEALLLRLGRVERSKEAKLGKQTHRIHWKGW